MVFDSNAIVDLWVLPPPAQSQWFARVDWYLNWQLCRGLAHEKIKPSVELFRVMETSGFRFEPPPVVPAGAPLLVASAGRLPAGRCLVVEGGKSLKTWLRKVADLAGDLQVATVRVFLPAGAKIAEARMIVDGFEQAGVKFEFSADEEAKT